jgi:hypothetical protein
MLNKPGTRVEFRIEGHAKHLAVLSNVGAVPASSDLISIRGKTYRVMSVTWAVDQADRIGETELRANVDLELVAE